MQKKGRKVKVMVYGTFDVLHPGHLYFLEQAKKLGNVLIVSVARDENARYFKGKKPIFSEQDRQKIVSALRVVDKAVLGDRGYYLPHTLKEKPHIIALGYDQTAYENHLRADVASGRLRAKIIRLKPYQPGRHKSTRYKNKIRKT